MQNVSARAGCLFDCFMLEIDLTSVDVVVVVVFKLDLARVCTVNPLAKTFVVNEK